MALSNSNSNANGNGLASNEIEVLTKAFSGSLNFLLLNFPKIMLIKEPFFFFKLMVDFSECLGMIM